MPVGLLVSLSPDPLSMLSLLSLAVRVAEDFGELEAIHIAVTERHPEEPQQLARIVQEILGRLGLPSLKVRVHRLSGWLSRIMGLSARIDTIMSLRRLARELSQSYEALVVSPSPGSRRSAAETGIAVESILHGLHRRIELVFLDFLWGPWKGLVYPYTPRIVEPLTSLTPAPGVAEEKKKSKVVASAPSIIDNSCRTPWGPLLPPLRCAIAELSKIINQHTGPGPFIDEAEEDVSLLRPRTGCGDLEVVVSIASLRYRIRIQNVCWIPDWLEAAKQLSALFSTKIPKTLCGEHSCRGIDQLIGIAGLWRLKAEKNTLSSQFRELIADTSLIYAGLHNEAYMGVHVLLPYCAVTEVLKRLAEHSKRTSNPIEATLDLLAAAAIRELEALGYYPAPSPPPPCDTAIPSMDPLLLSGRIMATRDTGAYTLWRRHPSSTISKPILAVLEPISIHELYREPGFAIYSVLQAIIVLSLLSNMYKQFTIELVVGGKELKPSVKPLLEERV